MLYLAVPYSHPEAGVRHDRFVKVNLAAAALMRQGFLVFSPISHGHPICSAGALPGSWQYWENVSRAILQLCKLLIVLQLDGWEDSTGVVNEIRIAKELGIPIEYRQFSNLVAA